MKSPSSPLEHHKRRSGLDPEDVSRQGKVRMLLNDTVMTTRRHPGTTVLDLVRGEAGLCGTKEGCREGDCGACLVLIGEINGNRVAYRSVCSCLLPIGEVAGGHVVTVDGLSGDDLNPVQRAIVEHGATQCGFCTPGIVVGLTEFLLSSPRVDVASGVKAIEGNICRCTGYVSLCRAVGDLVERFRPLLADCDDRVPVLVAEGVVPRFFLDAAGTIAGWPRSTTPAHDAGTTIVAGGTDLLVQRPDDIARTNLQFVPRPAAADVELIDGMIVIPAATPVESFRTSPLLSAQIENLAVFCDLVSSRPIRHQATVAGNLVNASPIGDLTIMLLALGADLVLRGPNGSRVIPLNRFYQGYKILDLRPREFVDTIRIPCPAATSRFNFEKVSKRTHLDIASVNSAASITTENGSIIEAKLSAGGVSPIPLNLEKTARYLHGRPVSTATALKAAQMATTEIRPIDDVRGSAEYKSLLLRQLILAHFNVLFGLEEGLV